MNDEYDVVCAFEISCLMPILNEIAHKHIILM